MSADEKKSALFAGLVMQQSNAVLMLLGKTPHPETGKTMRDLQSAQYFIDLLELIEEKTRGNLTPEEERMIKSTLTSLRMAFVEAVNEGESPTQTTPSQSPPGESAPPSAASAADHAADSSPPEEESRKKFTKKY